MHPGCLFDAVICANRETLILWAGFADVLNRYIPRVLGPAFVDKLELMVWSDDRRWADRSGHPWSNHCLFKSGGKGEDTGSMSYAERRVMEKVHVILQACSRLQWRCVLRDQCF